MGGGDEGGGEDRGWRSVVTTLSEEERKLIKHLSDQGFPSNALPWLFYASNKDIITHAKCGEADVVRIVGVGGGGVRFRLWRVSKNGGGGTNS